MMDSGERTPLPVDRHVGARVRLRRKVLGVSQGALAGALGLTFQQVQKYEKGANRISASKLYDIAVFLSAPVSWFFEGLADPEKAQTGAGNGAERAATDFLATPEGLELATNFPKIRARQARSSVLTLVRALAEHEDAPTPKAPVNLAPGRRGAD